MMFGKRYSVTGKLVVNSHLHIGGSDNAQLSASGEEECSVSPVAMGFAGPIIPATALKGVLRHALSLADNNSHPLGFGTEKTQGHVAKLWLDHAPMVKGPDAATLGGLSDISPVGSRFCAKHMSQNPKTGAALDGHLYTREMVAKGSVFNFSAEWLGEDLGELANTLAPLVTGLQVGAATSKGAGAVQLDLQSIKLKLNLPDIDGTMTCTECPDEIHRQFLSDIQHGVLSSANQHIVMTLEGDGPYLSIRKTGSDDSNNIAQPLEHEGMPVLWAESVAGALRQRARWMAEVARSKAPDGMRPMEIPMDDPKLEKALGGAKRVTHENDLSQLSAVERLFGVTGAKALLTIKSVTCIYAGQSETIMSNSIDRLTGATRGGALFGRRTYWSPRFEVVLEIEQDNACLEALLSNLQTEGIELGHGASKGYGWFNVEVKYDRV